MPPEKAPLSRSYATGIPNPTPAYRAGLRGSYRASIAGVVLRRRLPAICTSLMRSPGCQAHLTAEWIARKFDISSNTKKKRCLRFVVRDFPANPFGVTELRTCFCARYSQPRKTVCTSRRPPHWSVSHRRFGTGPIINPLALCRNQLKLSALNGKSTS